MQFKIVEFDRDYHAITDVEFKEFSSREEAEAYCQERSGGGYDYFISKFEYDGPDYPEL